MSRAEPREDSGVQVRSRLEAEIVREEEEPAEVGRVGLETESREGFCWTRAMKPGMLSLADGVGWT